MKKWILLLIALPAGLALATPAMALKVEPGLWETTFTMTLPFMPNPQVRTQTECVEESDVDLDTFVDDEDNPCDAEVVVDNDELLSVRMTCPGPQGGADGFWKIASTGDTVSGDGGTAMTMNGQVFTASMKMSGKRVGACAP